jgi:small subunit ribosomal protein S2
VATVLVKELIEAGVHFGHRASRWNPKMRPYIYGRRNLIHVIDVRETIRGLLRARRYVQQVAAGGSLVLFVGTKRQASETIENQSMRCGMPYVADRWLGGTLTNFRTIRSRLTRLEELEALRSSEEIDAYSKKMQSALTREYRKMFRDLPIPGNDDSIRSIDLVISHLADAVLAGKAGAGRLKQEEGEGDGEAAPADGEAEPAA